MAASVDRKLSLGVIGLGRAFTLMRPAFAAAPEIVPPPLS